MSATSIPAGHALPADDAGLRELHAASTLDRLTLMLLFAFIGTLHFSIAVAQAFLAATIVCWVAQLVRDRERPAAPAFFWPLLAFAGASLLSVLFSLNFVFKDQTSTFFLFFFYL